MKVNLTKVLALVFVSGILSQGQAQDKTIIYKNDFEKAAVDALPDGFLAIDGDFKVKEQEGNKVLELPGTPAENFYGVLFGSSTNAGVCVSARIYGTGSKRRFPSFGVGLNGGSEGYCLRMSPGHGALEIYKGDEMRTNTPITWKSGTWTMLRLQVLPTGQSWMVEGKAWEQGTAEPKDWMVAIEEKTAPASGRPSVWGTPYSATPIWYDDLMVSEAGK